MAPCGPLHLPRSARYRASSASQLHASILSAILSSPQAWRNRKGISSWVTQRLLAVSCSCWTLVDACRRQDVPLNLPSSSNTVSEISELVRPCLGSQSQPWALKSEKPWWAVPIAFQMTRWTGPLAATSSMRDLILYLLYQWVTFTGSDLKYELA
jgi:hypothetical protein